MATRANTAALSATKAPEKATPRGVQAASAAAPTRPRMARPVTSPRVLEVTRRLTDGHEPSWLHRRLDPFLDDRGAFREEGLRVAVEDGRRLLAEGVPLLHLYSLNQAANVEALVAELGLAG